MSTMLRMTLPSGNDLCQEQLEDAIDNGEFNSYSPGECTHPCTDEDFTQPDPAWGLCSYCGTEVPA